MTDTNTTPAELVITRTFNAPRELVWKAWTEADRLAHWWGPKGFTMKVANLDLRPGGMFHYAMTAPNGQEMWGKFVYEEVVAPERIVYINSFSNEAGELLRHPMAPTWPLEVYNVMTFTEENGKTTITMTGRPHNATEEERQTFEAAMKNVQQGMGGTLDQLDAYLAEAK